MCALHMHIGVLMLCASSAVLVHLVPTAQRHCCVCCCFSTLGQANLPAIMAAAPVRVIKTKEEKKAEKAAALAAAAEKAKAAKAAA